MKKNAAIFILMFSLFFFSHNHAETRIERIWSLTNSNKFWSIVNIKDGFEASQIFINCVKNKNIKYSVLSSLFASLKFFSAYKLWNKKETDEADKMDLKLLLIENAIGTYFVFSMHPKILDEKIFYMLKIIQLTLSSFLAIKKLQIKAIK